MVKVFFEVGSVKVLPFCSGQREVESLESGWTELPPLLLPPP
jgi:hypothetical protein